MTNLGKNDERFIDIVEVIQRIDRLTCEINDNIEKTNEEIEGRNEKREEKWKQQENMWKES